MAAGIRIGGRKINFIYNRNYLKPRIHRKIRICKRLRLDALRGIHHEQRTLAGIQRARDLVVEVNVTGRVDEVQLVNAAVGSLVIEPDGARLDGYAALAFKVHVVKDLILHVALGNGAGRLKQAVGKRAFAVVNMCYYRKISYMCAVGSLHAPPCLS